VLFGIQKDPVHGGILEFGTELVTAADGSVVAMLGASPGAYTAVWIMVRVIERCLAEQPWKRPYMAFKEGGKVNFLPDGAG
jgi:L-2-hydroxyglutarate oxidase LhgO